MARLGPDSFVPEQRFLADDEALEVIRHFRRHHPVRLRLFRTALGWDDLREDDAVRAFAPNASLRRLPTRAR